MSVVSNGWLLAFGFSPGPAEMLVVLVVALLLYGGRLPEVARSWGKSFAEFRRGLNGIQNEINDVIYGDPERLEYHEPEYHDSEYHESDATHAASSETSSEELSEQPAEESEESSEPSAVESSEESSDVVKTDQTPPN